MWDGSSRRVGSEGSVMVRIGLSSWIGSDCGDTSRNDMARRAGMAREGCGRLGQSRWSGSARAVALGWIDMERRVGIVGRRNGMVRKGQVRCGLSRWGGPGGSGVVRPGTSQWNGR